MTSRTSARLAVAAMAAMAAVTAMPAATAAATTPADVVVSSREWVPWVKANLAATARQQKGWAVEVTKTVTTRGTDDVITRIWHNNDGSSVYASGTRRAMTNADPSLIYSSHMTGDTVVTCPTATRCWKKEPGSSTYLPTRTPLQYSPFPRSQLLKPRDGNYALMTLAREGCAGLANSPTVSDQITLAFCEPGTVTLNLANATTDTLITQERNPHGWQVHAPANPGTGTASANPFAGTLLPFVTGKPHGYVPD